MNNNKKRVELAKVGGVYWPTDPSVPIIKSSTGVSPLEKTDSIADFLHDAKQFKTSTSVDLMLSIKREKQQRQFMNYDLKVDVTFK
jgi:hypothetical protein